MSGVCSLAQLSRRHDVSSGLILYWKKRYEGEGKGEGLARNEKQNVARIAELERMVGRLTMENELLKKAVEYTAEKRVFVTDHRQDFSNLQRGCEMMGLARSTYDYRSRQKSLQAKKEEVDLRGRIEQIVVEFARYGCRRATRQLRREGWKVNHKWVARMMREQSLQCHIKRRWVKTTDSEHSYRIIPICSRGSMSGG